MDRFVTLVGAEEVSRAASRMQEAADTFSRAASGMDSSLAQHQRFMDDWLARFEQAVERLSKAEG